MNPSGLTSLLPGGTSGAQVAGTQAAPGMVAPRREGCEQEVLDVTSVPSSGTLATPAAQGKLLVQDLTVNAINPASKRGGTWRLSATASAAIPYAKFGVVMISGQNSPNLKLITAVSGTSQGVKAQVIYDGPVAAYCTTTGTAIAPGTLLGADGAGNLTPIASPAAGEVLAIAADTLAASTSTPTLVAVDVGGY